MSGRAPNDEIETAGGVTTVGDLRARCRVLEPGIILVREAPYSNAEVFDVFMKTAVELAEPFDTFAIVNDLEEAKTRPRREHLDAIVRAINDVGVHWAIVQPGSAFLRTVARFVLARVARGGGRTSVHEDMDDAISAARSALKSGAS